jgi:hypothetical protein
VTLDIGFGVDEAVADSAFIAVEAGSEGRRFCIFCIRERLRASNRLRNMEENVLNFRHYTAAQRRISDEKRVN